MDAAKRVLIIAYLFPPIGGIGVQRALKFAKYLVSHGWMPIVLTTEEALSATMDERLLDEIPEEVKVVRVRDPLVRLMKGAVTATAQSDQEDQSTLQAEASLRGTARRWLKRLKDMLLMPDENILWGLKAALVATRIIREEGISCVFTTSSPISTHLVGLFVQHWTRVKWIADFRDPWTDNMHYAQTGWRAQLERRLERAVLTNASAVTTVTDSFAELFTRKFPKVARKLTVIRNGVDPADFPPLAPTPSSGRFTMLYAGILYPKRSPEAFLKALSQAIRSGRIHPDSIRVEFAGVFDYPGSRSNQELVERLHLQKVVKVLGYLSHEEVVVRMTKAHSLLLIGDTDPTSAMYIPGKLYEYMYTRRPIFAMMQQGEATQLIEHYQAGVVVSPTDVSAIEDNIVELAHQFLTSGPAAEERSVPSVLTRPYQAEQLARLMDELTSAARVGSSDSRGIQHDLTPPHDGYLRLTLGINREKQV